MPARISDGQQSTALLGSVASSLALAAKKSFTGGTTSGRGHDKGIGRPAILRLLRTVPGITENSVRESALAEGIEEADIALQNLDDEAMIRVYARENATQRGQQSTALLGSVASSLALAAKKQFIGAGDSTSTSKFACKDQGIGRPAILRLLRTVPGITDNSIKEQLANLKASGHYARILKEVEEVIEEEARLAQAKADRLKDEAHSWRTEP